MQNIALCVGDVVESTVAAGFQNFGPEVVIVNVQNLVALA